MAKDSDKKRVLEKRRVELLHSIEHDADQEMIQKRVIKLLEAIYAVAKKEQSRIHPFTSEAKNEQLQAIKRGWESLAIEKVVAIVAGWPENPTYREVQAIVDSPLP